MFVLGLTARRCVIEPKVTGNAGRTVAPEQGDQVDTPHNPRPGGSQGYFLGGNRWVRPDRWVCPACGWARHSGSDCQRQCEVGQAPKGQNCLSSRPRSAEDRGGRGVESTLLGLNGSQDTVTLALAQGLRGPRNLRTLRRLQRELLYDDADRHPGGPH